MEIQDFEEPMREVPIHIDASERLGESIIIAFATFTLGNTLRALFGGEGGGILISVAAAIVVMVIYLRQTMDKPDGLLLHKLSRKITNYGLDVMPHGLLSPTLRRIRR